MLKIALTGFSQGYYAVQYTRYLSRLKGIKVIGVCDLGMSADYLRECAFMSAVEFAEELGCPLYHRYEEILAEKPDALLICSETWEHVKMAEKAMKLGIHTFVSKPLCFSFSQIAGLCELKQENICLLCGNPLKYEQGIVEFRDRIKSGEIGKVYSIRMMLNHRAMTAQEWERNPARSGGPLGTYGVYLFDLARWMTGQVIRELAAFGDNFATPEIEAEDTVKILGIQADESQCSLELYSGIRHEFPFVRVEAIGEKGTLVSNYENYVTIEQTEEGVKFGGLRNTDMTAGEMEHFLDCVLNGTTERCGLTDMTYVVRCIDAVFQSMEQHAIVRLEGI